jgi:hypothetical protein
MTSCSDCPAENATDDSCCVKSGALMEKTQACPNCGDSPPSDAKSSQNCDKPSANPQPSSALLRMPPPVFPFLAGLLGAGLALIGVLIMPFASSPFVWGTTYSYMSFSHTRALSVVILSVAGAIALSVKGYLIGALAACMIVAVTGFDLYRNVISVSQGSLHAEAGGIIVILGAILLLAASLCASLLGRRHIHRSPQNA